MYPGRHTADVPSLRKDPFPSRLGFFHEALHPAPTLRTPNFDDYTRGSYHVDKIELARLLPAYARRCNLTLLASLTIGPTAMLWAYHVIVFVQEGDNVRVNRLVFPHARITLKTTVVVPRQAADQLLESLRDEPLLKPGLPALSTNDPLRAEFSFNVLLALYADSTSDHYFGNFDPFAATPHATQFFDSVNKVLEGSEPSYQHGKSRPDPKAHTLCEK